LEGKEPKADGRVGGLKKIAICRPSADRLIFEERKAKKAAARVSEWTLGANKSGSVSTEGKGGCLQREESGLGLPLLVHRVWVEREDREEKNVHGREG